MTPSEKAEKYLESKSALSKYWATEQERAIAWAAFLSGYAARHSEGLDETCARENFIPQEGGEWVAT